MLGDGAGGAMMRADGAGGASRAASVGCDNRAGLSSGAKNASSARRKRLKSLMDVARSVESRRDRYAAEFGCYPKVVGFDRRGPTETLK